MGEPVLVEVRFPQLVNKTMIRGQVAWCRAGKHRTKIRAGLGIEFHAGEAQRRDFLISVAKGQGRAAVARRHRRLPVMLSARWRCLPEREWHMSSVEDIGPGGAFVRTDQTVTAGAEVVLDVMPPGSVAAIELAGRVAWIGQEGFGVEFRCRDAGGGRRLKELIRRLELIEEQAAVEIEVGEEELLEG